MEGPRGEKVLWGEWDKEERAGQTRVRGQWGSEKAKGEVGEQEEKQAQLKEGRRRKKCFVFVFFLLLVEADSHLVICTLHAML